MARKVCGERWIKETDGWRPRVGAGLGTCDAAQLMLLCDTRTTGHHVRRRSYQIGTSANHFLSIFSPLGKTLSIVRLAYIDYSCLFCWIKIFSSAHNDSKNGKKDLNEAAATDYRVVSHRARAAGVTPQEPLTSG